MEIIKIIKSALKEKKVIIGYKQVLRQIKIGNPEIIIYANNLPKDKLEELEHNTKTGSIKTCKFPKDSIELGLVCKKPFSVSILAIKR